MSIFFFLRRDPWENARKKPSVSRDENVFAFVNNFASLFSSRGLRLIAIGFVLFSYVEIVKRMEKYAVE